MASAGAAIERLVEDDARRRRLQTAATVIVAATGVAFYCNARWTRPFWPLLRIDSGRDWMLNTWLLSLDHRTTSPALHLGAAAAFATYPAWTRPGRRVGRRQYAAATARRCGTSGSRPHLVDRYVAALEPGAQEDC